MERINSAADNTFEPDFGSRGGTSYDVSTDGADPYINTVGDSVGSTPSPNSGQQALPTTKTISLDDTGGDKIRSAAG